MKKIKMAIFLLAITGGVSAAVAAKQSMPCWAYQQYYIGLAGNYYEAGELGVDYVCMGSIFTCTYYQPNFGVYVACKWGLHVRVFGGATPSAEAVAAAEKAAR
jgi:hypothetical protein